MQLVLLTVNQLVVMFLYLLAGFILFRLGVITVQGSRDLAGMLVKFIVPVVVIRSFCKPFSLDQLGKLGVSALVAALLLGLSILTARLLFKKAPLAHFGAAFSNAGFMGLPLVQATLGETAVFYVVAFVAFLNLLQWTYGVDVICEVQQRRTPAQLCRQLLWNPPMVSIGVGLLLFVSGLGIRLPAVLDSTLAGVAALNSPLAMMVLGVYLAQVQLSTIFTDRSLYAPSLVRGLLIPALSLAVLWVLPVPRDVALAVLICASAPIGSNVAVYAQLHGRDHTYASKMVVLSTLLSLFTLPAVAGLATRLL